ncbi:TLD domain-containing protein 1 [Nymphon striatum]|nr:TLD domain-containing protein 1 [Nymphon striatum]
MCPVNLLTILYPLLSVGGISLKNVEGADPPKQKFTESEFESWLTKCPLVSTVISKVIAHHFHISSDSENDEKCIKIPNLIFPRGPVKSGLLDIPAIVMINSNLPSELQNEWTLLFSTMKDGESFSSFVQHIVQEGPTALLVRDKDGHTFGGFASSSWELNASFTGKDNCFLFNTFPRFGIYGTTGYNDHYMYINQHQQTLPNGLGMGGQFDYFGLWIDSNFGSGKCSSSCTTFENPMLSSMENFKFDAIEVWRVGPKPKKDEDEEGDHGSILDKDPLAKAMLMLIDKGTLSEGLREADPTADSPEDKILPPL